MRRVNKILSAAFILALFCHSVHAEVFDGYYGGESHNLYENSIVLENASLEVQNLNITDSLTLENHGTISSDIFIYSQKNLFLKNNGVILGDISLGAGANLFLVVNGADDLNAVNVVKPEARFTDDGGTSFAVLVDGVSGLDFPSLNLIASNMDKLVLKDSLINFKPGTKADVPIELFGEVIFDLGSAKLTDGEILLGNVSGEGTLLVHSNNLSRLFFISTERQDEDIILHVSRETDYAKIFDDNRGDFLNNTRARGASSKLLAKMDAAQSESELGRIMNDSVAFNPVNLMKPLKLMVKSEMAGTGNLDGISGNMMTIFGNDLLLYMGSIGADFSNNGFNFGFSLHAGSFSNNGLEDFGGKIYGGTGRIAINRKLLYAEAMAGFSFAKFDTDGVYDAAKAEVYNPTGFAYYGAAEVGTNAFELNGFYATPIVRARAFSAKVLDSSESDFAFGAGGRAGYRESVIGITTDYGLFGLMESDGMQFGARMEVFSKGDDVAVGLEASALEYESAWFYKFGAGVKVLF
ncbi:MAG: hypothetical protein FWE50_01050 [Alphaproteobacteria bacterium]|nr:hypothetical protein [Alphaproteobacteria bacterium]